MGKTGTGSEKDPVPPRTLLQRFTDVVKLAGAACYLAYNALRLGQWYR
ncbi:hypothetical protein ACIHCM_34485 [Streptomyces sp. NPDC052023]